MKNYFNKIKNDKNKLLVLEILGVVVLSLGFTYALNYISKTINASITTANINVVYTGDSTITKDLFLPIKESEIEEHAAIANFTVKGAENNPADKDIIYDITLTDVDITSGLLDENFKFQLLKNNIVIGEGNFSNLQVEKKEKEYTYYQRVVLNENVMDLPKYTDTADSFSLRIYILDNGLDQSTLMGQSFKANVEIATYTTKGSAASRDKYTNLITKSVPNAPVLAEGMIPVTYSDTLSTWVKADVNNADNNWYDYSNQKWANATLVTSTSRSTYMSASVGTEVKEADILAYLVWIPRYKYKLFNVDFESIEPQVIDVVFENGTSTTGTTKCSVSEIGVETCTNKENGNYYTHPAFTFVSQELEGIWLAKFETTGTATTPTVKPNLTSLKNQNVSTQFITSQKMNSTTYLTTNGVSQSDSHMMKNIEWGAVAYLKQSKYGLGLKDIGVNNYYDSDSSKTGCGSAAESTTSTTCYAYNTEAGMLASTTGNITGVYDMSGGNYESVMGVMQDENSTTRSPMSGTSANYNSGFFGIVGSGYVDSGNTLAFPDAKYYDLYASGADSNEYTRSHLGDATGETRGWYGDDNNFNNFASPWFARSGNFNGGTYVGIFNFIRDTGSSSKWTGFRLVICTTDV